LPREAAHSNDAATAWNASARSVTANNLDELGGGEDPGGENPELLQILSAIADDVSRHCATVCASINAEFSARMAQARKSSPRGQVAGALQALKQARVAALTFARQMAKMELHSRQETAKIWHSRSGRRPVSAARRLPVTLRTEGTAAPK
jgi:hypothetical protein